MTTRPKRLRIMGRSARRVSRKAADRLVSITLAQSSSSIWGDSPSARTPALLTSTSTGPSSSSSRENSASAASGSEMSACTASAWPPASTISLTTASALSESLR